MDVIFNECDLLLCVAGMPSSTHTGRTTAMTCLLTSVTHCD